MFQKSDFARGYSDLQKRIVRRLKLAKTQRQIFDAIDKNFNCALAEESILLSRAERKRLQVRVTKSVLEDMVAKMEAAAYKDK